MIYLLLFWEFFKTGLLAVGGGLATLPFLSNMADTTGWFTHSQLADMVAVSESTPGPMGVNMATYVGYTTAGIPGALIATLGLITPSIIVILIIAGFLKSFRDNRLSIPCSLPPSGFHGSHCSFRSFRGGHDFLRRFRYCFHYAGRCESLRWKALVLAVILLVVTRWIKPTKKLHPIVWILASAVWRVFSFAGV